MRRLAREAFRFATGVKRNLKRKRLRPRWGSVRIWWLWRRWASAHDISVLSELNAIFGRDPTLFDEHERVLLARCSMEYLPSWNESDHDLVTALADAAYSTQDAIVRYEAEILEAGNSNSGLLRRCVAFDGQGLVLSRLIEKHFMEFRGSFAFRRSGNPCVEAQVYKALEGGEALQGCRTPVLLGEGSTPYGWRLWLEDLTESGCRKVRTPRKVELAERIALAVGQFSGYASLSRQLENLSVLAPGDRLPGVLRVKWSRRYLSKVIDDLTHGAVDGDAFADAIKMLFSLAGMVVERAGSDGVVTVCHGDVHSGNVMEEPDGGLVLMDFEKAFWGPVGLDVGRFLGEPLMLAARRSKRDKMDLTSLCDEWRRRTTDAYLDGLKQAGVSVDHAVVRSNVDYFFVLSMAVLLCVRECEGSRRDQHREGAGTGRLLARVQQVAEGWLDEVGRTP